MINANKEDALLMLEQSDASIVESNALYDFAYEMSLTFAEVIRQLIVVSLSVFALSLIFLKAYHLMGEDSNKQPFSPYAFDKLGFFVPTDDIKNEKKEVLVKIEEVKVNAKPQLEQKVDDNMDMFYLVSIDEKRVKEIKDKSVHHQLAFYEAYLLKLESTYQQKSLDERSYEHLLQEVQKKIFWEKKAASIRNMVKYQ